MSYLLRRITRNPYMFMAKALWSIEGAIFSKFVNNSFCLVVIINTGRPYSSLASICSRSFVLGLSFICHLSKYHYNILMPPPPPPPPPPPQLFCITIVFSFSWDDFCSGEWPSNSVRRCDSFDEP